jgi:1-phosphatidylinositol-3-phosphate 5-kinase
LLKGANGDELKKVKHVVHYGVFAAYHLALETSFLVDEGATLPELPLKSPIIVALPDKPSSADRSISTIPILTMPSASPPNNNMQTFDLCNDDLTFNVIKRTMSACSPGNNICQRSGVGTDETTSVLIKDQNGNIDCLLIPQSSIGPLVQQSNIFARDVNSNLHFEECKSDSTKHTPYWMSVENDDSSTNNSGIGDNMAEKPAASLNVQVFHDDDSSKDDSFTKKDEIPASPADNQSILVSLSSHCVWKETLCERPHLLRIKYYGNFDRPLGRFLRDQLFDQVRLRTLYTHICSRTYILFNFHIFLQNNLCRSCELPPEAHVYCYVHPQGSLSISVRKLAEKLPGEHDGRIWMWHRCLRCPRVNGLPPATKRVVMSDAAWGLSFGKFLELSFSNHAAASRVASCGHSLHRDCLRFYGYILISVPSYQIVKVCSLHVCFSDSVKWLHASDMHPSRFTLYFCHHQNLILLPSIRNG